MAESVSHALATVSLRPRVPAISSEDDIRVEFEALFAEHRTPLGRFLHQIVRDRAEAEDLLQDTFAAAWRERAGLPEIKDRRAWLFAIARNRALGSLRKGRRSANVLARLRRTAGYAEDASEAVAVRDFLLRHLDSDDRALIVLRYVHGFNASELSQITGASPAAVRQRLARACRRLNRALNDHPSEQ